MVGGIIGSSLLTVVAFVLILRRRRNKRRHLLRGGSARGRSGSGGNPNIGYPELVGTSNKAYAVKSTADVKKTGPGYAASDDGSSTYSTDDSGFKFPLGDGIGVGDEKALAAAAVAPPAAALALSRSNTNITRKSVGAGPGGSRTRGVGVGYAVSYYGPSRSVSGAGTAKFQLGNPPPPRGKFSLFPKNRDEFSAQSTSTASPADEDEKQQTDQAQRASRASFPSLDVWLRSGTNVSPFSTLKAGQS